MDEIQLRKFIRQEIKKTVNETDLIATNKPNWESKKSEFKTLVANLIKNLESDDYTDAEGEISKTIGILKSWKTRINKGLVDSELKENSNPILASQIILHHLPEAFHKYIIPGTEKSVASDEDGTYSAEVQLAIPREYFKDLEEATFKTKEQIAFNNYSGPGQSYSRGHVYAIKQNAKFYILGFSINGGYDI